MRQYRETEAYRAALKEYNALAKKADRYMRNLEKLSEQPGYRNVKKYAYAKAKKMIEGWTPPEKQDKAPRWQRNTPADTRTLKAKINDIKSFLDMPTATKRGITRIYKQRAKTLNEKYKKYGVHFTWEDLAEFFDSGMADKTFNKYGSDTVLISIGTIKKNEDEVVKKLTEHEPVHLKIEGDEKVRQTTEKLLRYYKKDIRKVLM